jgi:hypothetical protein
MFDNTQDILYIYFMPIFSSPESQEIIFYRILHFFYPSHPLHHYSLIILSDATASGHHRIAITQSHSHEIHKKQAIIAQIHSCALEPPNSISKTVLGLCGHRRHLSPDGPCSFYLHLTQHLSICQRTVASLAWVHPSSSSLDRRV